jgi:hypothetical protein
MKSATELYHIKPRKPCFTVANVEFPIKMGMLATIEAATEAASVSPKTLRAVGAALGAGTQDKAKINDLLRTYAQLEWYEAKGGVPPERVVTSYNEALAAAAPPDAPKAPPAVRASMRASGPTGLARRLIADGVDSDEVMKQVKAAFGKESGHPLKFERGDLNRLRRKIEEAAS